MKGAIFDLDGTLLDSMGVWQEVDKMFFAKRFIVMPDDYIAAITPLGYRATAEYTIKRFSLNETPEALMEEWRQSAADAYANRVMLKPGARKFLEKLKAGGVMLAVATASDPVFYESTLKRFGILDWFHNITLTAEVPRGKGNPDVYLRCAEKMGLRPNECTVFEDIYEGISAAKSAGFKTVAVYEPASANKDLIRKTADRIIFNFNEY
jgi:HAD superfamily hydrolase (TIGR01509 family)